MESATYVKNTPALLIAGLLIMILFVFLLRREITRFNPNTRFSKLLFILENYELIGGFLLGLLLLLLGLFG